MVPWKDSLPVGIRLACVTCLGLLWASGYFLVGSWAQTSPSFNPSTSLDIAIPFVGWAVWAYLFGIVWIVTPAIVVRSPDLFGQTAFAYFTVITFSFLCFFLVPTQTENLRSQASSIGVDHLTRWAIQTLHIIDPPTNLLPSLHVSLSTIATAALKRQYRGWERSLFCLLTVIIVSVCMSKQHTIADVAGGLAVGLTAWRAAMRLKLTMLHVGGKRLDKPLFEQVSHQVANHLRQ